MGHNLEFTLPYHIVNLQAKTLADLNLIDNIVTGWENDKGRNQKWRFDAPIDDGYTVYIINEQTGGYLTASNMPDSNGLYPVFASFFEKDNKYQWWYVTWADGNSVTFSSVGRSYNLLDLSGGGTTNGTQIITYANDGGKNQMWDVVRA